MLVASLDDDLASLSLEALMNIKVTSVSKKEETLQEAAGAIYVLDGDSIRRAGVKTLAEALRLVPGLQVARIDSHTWAISARGFNSSLADKLEVLMDGRSLYTPLYSGVFWDAQDTLLEDIDRIEVIRGPGAALWGANAVNGVINIVTKSADETQGGFEQVGGGGEFDGFGAWRYGGKLGEKGNYRAYAKTTLYKAQEMEGPRDANDHWQITQSGVRTDWQLSELDTLTVQGDVYQGHIFNKTVNRDETMSGGNVLTHWRRQHGENKVTDLQFYYDRTERNNRYNFGEKRDTVDIDIRHHFHWGNRQEWVVGGGYRRTSDSIDNVNPAITTFAPNSRDDDTYNFYVQDQVAIVPEKLRLTLGTKFENNDYTGDEVQPSLRLAYTINDRNTVWAAVSKAVRIPNRLDHTVQLSDGSGLFRFDGSKDFESEELVAYEVGYRTILLDTLSADVALFYNEYDKLRGVTPDPTAIPLPFVFLISNEGEGDSQGGELVLRWEPHENMSVIASYQHVDLNLRPKSGSLDTSINGNDQNDPQNQAMLIVDWDISDRWIAHTAVRWVDELKDQTVNARHFVEDYFGLDASVTWKFSPAFEFSVVGKNLLDPSHPEFGGGVEIQRSVHGQVTWNF